MIENKYNRGNHHPRTRRFFFRANSVGRVSVKHAEAKALYTKLGNHSLLNETTVTFIHSFVPASIGTMAVYTFPESAHEC